MPQQSRDSLLGERIASLEATIRTASEYDHKRWHKLDQDLTLIVNLPERLTRDVAKMQGLFDGKFETFRKDIERSVGDAIEAALNPIHEDVSELKVEIEKLKTERSELTGGKRIVVWFIQSIISAAAAIAGLFALRGSH